MTKAQITIEPLTNDRGLRLAGELDASNVFSLTEPLEEEARQGGDLTLDLTELTFIDSAGIHLLIRAAKTLEGRGRMRLLCPEGPVRKVLLLVGFPTSLDHVVLEPAADDGGAKEPEST